VGTKTTRRGSRAHGTAGAPSIDRVTAVVFHFHFLPRVRARTIDRVDLGGGPSGRDLKATASSKSLSWASELNRLFQLLPERRRKNGTWSIDRNAIQCGPGLGAPTVINSMISALVRLLGFDCELAGRVKLICSCDRKLGFVQALYHYRQNLFDVFLCVRHLDVSDLTE
jgi:hypothetical protein